MPMAQERGRVSCPLNASQTLARKTQLRTVPGPDAPSPPALPAVSLAARPLPLQQPQQLPGHNRRPGAVRAAVREVGGQVRPPQGPGGGSGQWDRAGRGQAQALTWLLRAELTAPPSPAVETGEKGTGHPRGKDTPHYHCLSPRTALKQSGWKTAQRGHSEPRSEARLCFQTCLYREFPVWCWERCRTSLVPHLQHGVTTPDVGVFVRIRR